MKKTEIMITGTFPINQEICIENTNSHKVNINIYQIDPLENYIIIEMCKLSLLCLIEFLKKKKRRNTNLSIEIMALNNNSLI